MIYVLIASQAASSQTCLPTVTLNGKPPPTAGSAMPVEPIAWVDDVVILDSCSNEDLVQRIRSVMAVCNIHCSRRGLFLNMAPGKTAVLIAPAGPGSLEIQKDLFIGSKRLIAVTQDDLPCDRDMHVVSSPFSISLPIAFEY